VLIHDHHPGYIGWEQYLDIADRQREAQLAALGRTASTRGCVSSPHRTDLGKELYRKRQQSIEPVYGHTKHNRRFDRFHRRGRLAVRTEWRLITMSRNLTKLHRHQIATVIA
jgi:hypothetical protein